MESPLRRRLFEIYQKKRGRLKREHICGRTEWKIGRR